MTILYYPLNVGVQNEFVQMSEVRERQGAS